MKRIAEWLVVVASGGLIAAAAFSTTSEPLASLGLLSISFWIVALVILASGLLSALVLVDLKRAFLSAPAAAILAALFYAVALMAPAATMEHYTNHLLNYAMVQSVPVTLVTLVLMLLGVLVGTIINTSAREFDL